MHYTKCLGFLSEYDCYLSDTMGKKHKFYEKGAGKRKRRRDDEGSEDEESLELEDVPQASKHNVEVRLWRLIYLMKITSN